MDRVLNFQILKSPVNIMIVLLISTLGMLALAAIFGTKNSRSRGIPSAQKSQLGN
jgi:hypothetical protein